MADSRNGSDIVYENAHIERANGTIKNQYLYRWKITNFMQLCKKLKDAIWAYNYDRPHLAHHKIGKLTPVEFEEALKELSFEQRPELSIFTHSQNNDSSDDSQLKFDF